MIHSQTKFAFVALLCAVVITLVPTSASAYQSAPLNFCNNTSEQVNVAVGYHSPGVNDPADHSVLTGLFVSKGWYQIAAGACQTLDNPFSARYMFWYAFAKGYNDEGLLASSQGLSNTPYDFCVTNYLFFPVPSFTYELENASIKACESPDTPLNEHVPLWITPKMVDTWVSPNVSFTGQ